MHFDNRQRVESVLIDNMRQTMVHRGPDGHGTFIDGQIGLGHQRLSIIDIDSGQQPMTINENGRSLTIVFNGEIYNYLELQNDLKSHGHHFMTRSDTEVILMSYIKWGEQCVERFRGMFSFAIWDSNNKRLFISRDRLGIKPLYYYLDQNVFVFASEVKAILASGLVERCMELSSLDAFMTLGYVPAPQTMFKGIFKLMPGHNMTVYADGKFKTRRYWNVTYQEKSDRSFEQIQNELDTLLKESVRIRLMSEVPLGVFLSGGLDSSAIVALMSAVTDQQIKTFSVGYEGADEANELGFARKVADYFNTEHHEFILRPDDFFDSIPDFVNLTEEPLVETAAIPLYHISKKAKNYATVLLSGEGSDEIFAGYGLYEKMLRINKNRTWLKPLGIVPASWMKSEKYDKYIDWINNQLNQSFRGTSCDLTKRIKNRFYSDDFTRLIMKNDYLSDVFADYFREVEGQAPLSQMLYVDMKTWLLDDLLLKADKMTMAASVELRVPFLDHKVVEFASSIPPQYKLYEQNGKRVLKKLMEKYLPPEIIYRKKMGFTVPTKCWFGSSLIDQTKQILLSKSFLERGFFNRKYIERIIDNHQKCREDNSRRIFSLLVLDQWIKTFKC